MATDDENPATDCGSGGGVVELPAPDGWKKKYTPKKSSRRNDIVFISPAGDEIRSKRQLDKYLKSSCPGGPTASEFDWSTGETPRRSGRLSDKVKATEAPEIEPPSKRSSVKKGSRTGKEDPDIENEDLGYDEDVVVGKGDAESEGVEKTEGGEATENNAQGAIIEEPMMPVPEETVAGDSKKEQVDDHLDKQTEEITDYGTENSSLEKEAKAENEGGEINAGLDVIKEGPGVETETEVAGNLKPENNVEENNLAESNPELLGDHTVPEKGI
ncbi:hypothetical protein MLD38_003447 [Melastoma candidum]|uniref:Uncharacterized protein n=1 Tax=Melastoma candidum TaxID=119954 RepID=A0ACB9S2M6_9MYRT|nr:hypothetical protein MLD38_003447 [Melastoma candidum]